jgi:(p)ppGpp synthase/HD superfamily hydrolase
VTAIERAREFAIRAHADQMYSELPYSYHLDMVAAVARSVGASDAVVAAAYLHDTVEDTATTIDEIRAEFGDRIAALVEAVTDPPGMTRKEAKAIVLPRVRREGLNAILLKLCDTYANVLSGCAFNKRDTYLKMYAKGYPALRSEFGSFKNLAGEPHSTVMQLLDGIGLMLAAQ